MTNRKNPPDGCLVTTFSSSLPSRRTDMDTLGDRMLTRHRQPGATFLAPAPAGFRPRSMSRVRSTTFSRDLRLARPETRPASQLHGLPQDVFREAVDRERKRAERFGQPFALVLLEAIGDSPVEAVVWQQAIDAMSAIAGDTAILGWFEDRTVLGAILPDPGSVHEPQVRRGLAARLGPSTAAGFTVRAHIYSGPTTRAEAGGADDPFGIEAEGEPFERLAYHAIKRGLDIAGSLALLLLLAPVFLLITVLMMLTSPGPILYRQARVGRMGKPFTMLKFRSMRVNAEQKLHQEFVTNFIKSGGAQAGATGAKAPFKMANDPRITPLGRILRKTSLDELPQLWNVLRGDMSLVGPRPPLGYEVEQYRPWHWRRVLDAKPGVTGLWQVYGRSRTTFDDMVRLDIRYIRTCSVWNDLKILVATPRAVISGTGAN